VINAEPRYAAAVTHPCVKAVAGGGEEGRCFLFMIVHLKSYLFET